MAHWGTRCLRVQKEQLRPNLGEEKHKKDVSVCPLPGSSDRNVQETTWPF